MEQAIQEESVARTAAKIEEYVVIKTLRDDFYEGIIKALFVYLKSIQKS